MFPIIPVDPDSLIGDEQLGSKSKFWFQHDGKAWLFKQARDHTGEHWAEKIAAEVAARIGVPAARVELAEYLGRPGSASMSFVQPEESLVHGNEILAGQIVGYDRRKKLKQSDHTLVNIVAAISKLTPEWRDEVMTEFAWYPTLDALVCNTDRHHENWGFLTRIERTDQGQTLHFRLAPSFDHASSLGRELLQDRAASIVASDGIAAYARRGHGGIYRHSDDRRGANPFHLVELASADYPECFRHSLRAVASVPIADLQDVVDLVPGTVMSAASREFAKRLLAYTHGVLRGLAA